MWGSRLSHRVAPSNSLDRVGMGEHGRKQGTDSNFAGILSRAKGWDGVLVVIESKTLCIKSIGFKLINLAVLP